MCPNNDAHAPNARSASDMAPDLSSDMRHRPCCLRRGGAVVLCIPAPVRGRAERRVPVAPLGLMRCGLPQCEHQDFRRRRASARRSACGVFSACLHICLGERSPSPFFCAQGTKGKGSLKHLGRTRFDLVVRHAVQGFFPSQGRPSPGQWQVWPDPSCPKTDVTHEPRNAASPASTASGPAIMTIAIAPLSGAGRSGSYSFRRHRQEQNRNIYTQAAPSRRRTPQHRFCPQAHARIA
jgi:hypothetical protein